MSFEMLCCVTKTNCSLATAAMTGNLLENSFYVMCEGNSRRETTSSPDFLPIAHRTKRGKRENAVAVFLFL